MFNLKLNLKKDKIIYKYDVNNSETDITTLLNEIKKQGLLLKDINTEKSSLESIFINLVKGANDELLRN